MVVVSLESFLFTFERFIITRNKEKLRDETDLQGYAVILLYTIVSVATIMFLDKLKVKGRKRFLLDNGLLLALCYFCSSFIVVFSKYPRFILSAIILVLQMFSKANILTVILSVISIQNYETGFYFAFQLIVSQIFNGIGSIVYLCLPSEAMINYLFYIIIFLFLGSVQFVYRNLSEQHSESDTYSFSLWYDLFKVPLFFSGFFAFSLTLGVSSYTTSILFQVYPDLHMAIVELIILAMTVSYPITLIILYKKYRPINRGKSIVYGLILQALSLICLIPVYSNQGYWKVLIMFSPVFSQIGLVFITVATLPDMIDRASEKLMHVEFGVISDRVCSLVYGALYFGMFIINFCAFFFKEFVSFWVGMVLAAGGIIAFAGYYRKKLIRYRGGKKGLNVMFDGKELTEKVDLSNWLN